MGTVRDLVMSDCHCDRDRCPFGVLRVSRNFFTGLYRVLLDTNSHRRPVLVKATGTWLWVGMGSVLLVQMEASLGREDKGRRTERVSVV
jgi:hypothetical protein